MAHIGDGTVLKVVGLDYGYCAGEVGLLLGAVTHEDNFFKNGALHFEGDVDAAAAGYLRGICGIA